MFMKIVKDIGNKTVFAIAFVAFFGIQTGSHFDYGVTQAHATGCCGGGPKSGPGLVGESDPDSNDIGLGSLGPINAAIRDAASIIAAVGPAIREARENIEALRDLQDSIVSAGGLTHQQRSSRSEIVGGLIADEQNSIAEIRAGLEETLQTLTELLSLAAIEDPARQLQSRNAARDQAASALNSLGVLFSATFSGF